MAERLLLLEAAQSGWAIPKCRSRKGMQGCDLTIQLEHHVLTGNSWVRTLIAAKSHVCVFGTGVAKHWTA
jgi:hypothetical protein